MLVLGVDCGLHGALVLVEYETRNVVDLLDMPVITRGEASLVDPVELFPWLHRWEAHGVIAYVELVTAWNRTDRARGMDPKIQAAIANKIAKLIGLARGLETLLVLAGIPYQHVTPSAWKGRAGLQKKAKDAAFGVARAQLRWPQDGLKFKYHLGRAEAGLIALHGQAPDRVPRPKQRRITEEVAAEIAKNVPPGILFQPAGDHATLETHLPKRFLMRSRRPVV